MGRAEPAVTGVAEMCARGMLDAMLCEVFARAPVVEETCASRLF